MKTKCTHCGQEAQNQPDGNVCHTCSQGIMNTEREENRILRRALWWAADENFAIRGTCEEYAESLIQKAREELALTEKLAENES